MQHTLPPAREIIFLTHPAWTVTILSKATTDKFYRWTPKQAIDYFEQEVLPEIMKASKGTIVVLVKSPPDEGLEYKKRMLKGLAPSKIPKGAFKNTVNSIRRENGESATRERKRRGVEKIIEKKLQSIFGERLIVAHGEKFDYGRAGVSMEVENILRTRKIPLARKITIKGMGAWREQCATNYPREFLIRAKYGMKKKARFKLIENATIPIRQRSGNFKTNLHLYRPGK